MGKLSKLNSRLGLIQKMNQTPQKTSKKLNEINPIPEKKGVEVNEFKDTPQKESKEINTINPTPEKKGKDVNELSSTPEKIGKDINEFDNTSNLEGQGKDIDGFDNTTKLENQGKDIDGFDNSSKLVSEGKDVDGFDNTNKLENEGKDINVLDNSSKLVSEGKEVSPFSSIGNLEKLQTGMFSPIHNNDNADIINNDSPIRDRYGVSNTIEDHSLFDDLPTKHESSKWNDSYGNQNTYEDQLNSTPFGKLVDRSSDFMEGAPRLNQMDHLNNIGEPNSGENPTQAVNFMGDSTSYFGRLPNEIQGFINSGASISILQQTMLGMGFGDGTTNSNLGNLYSIRIGDGSDGSIFADDSGQNTTENKVFDPRSARTNIDTITNINPYAGSAFDNIYARDLQSFSGIGISDVMSAYQDSNIPELLHPQIDDGLSPDGYNSYVYDPRSEKIGVLPYGQTDVKFPNPKNPYQGTKFDDPLNEDLNEGGGYWNDDTQKYQTSGFRTINTPNLLELVVMVDLRIYNA